MANALLLLGLWLFETRVAERFWLSGALAYLPQHAFGLPTIALLAGAAWKKKWHLAGAYALTLGAFAHFFLGLQIPPPSTWASTWGGSRDRAKSVRVMSYNILGGTRGIKGVAGVIGGQKPDVVCLQEAVVINGSPDPVRPLQKMLPGYQVARAGEVAIFSRFPILTQRDHRLPPPASRFILEVVLDVRGVPVRVFAVHPYTIAFRGEGGARTLPGRIRRSLEVRRAQIEVLLSAAADPPSTWKREWREAPVVAAGDFNTPPRGREYDSLAEVWGDSWREAGWGMGKTYRSDLPVVRIDYVWHSKHWRARRAWTVASAASDHKALVADLELER